MLNYIFCSMEKSQPCCLSIKLSWTLCGVFRHHWRPPHHVLYRTTIHIRHLRARIFRIVHSTPAGILCERTSKSMSQPDKSRCVFSHTYTWNIAWSNNYCSVTHLWFYTRSTLIVCTSVQILESAGSVE